MQSLTLKKYQTRARNFYRKHCESERPQIQRKSARLLLKSASEYRPNSFGTLKSALAHDQKARGNHQAAKAIKQLVNPVTAQGSTLPKKPKLKQIRSISEEDYRELQEHLLAREFMDEAWSLVLAYYLGVRSRDALDHGEGQSRPYHRRKSAPQDRGADRTLVIDDPAVLQGCGRRSEMYAYLPSYQYSYSGSPTQRVPSAVAKAQTAPNPEKASATNWAQP